MKYTSTNKPLPVIMTQSTCYKGTETFKPKGIMWHSTGAVNPKICRYVQPSSNDSNKQQILNIIGTNTNGNDWNHCTVQAGVNAWIGYDASGNVRAVQSLPWNYAPWGCGKGSKGSCNTTHIQFEICESNLNDSAYFKKAYQEAIELTAYLCELYDIDPLGTCQCGSVSNCPTILCHNDSYKLGLGTGHEDVYNWMGPTKIVKKTMDDVRREVAELIKKHKAQATKQPVETYKVRFNKVFFTKKQAQKQIKLLQIEGITPIIVQTGIGHYWIQFGAFNNKTLALECKNKLRQQNIISNIITERS